jgi:hypothetical protein
VNRISRHDEPPYELCKFFKNLVFSFDPSGHTTKAESEALRPKRAEMPAKQACYPASETGQARDAPELVAQGVGVLALAADEVEAGAAGGGQVDEDV